MGETDRQRSHSAVLRVNPSYYFDKHRLEPGMRRYSCVEMTCFVIKELQ